MGPSVYSNCTPFQYCRSGKPPKLLPEYKMPDCFLEKSSKQRDKLVSKKREMLVLGLITSAPRLHSFDLSQASSAESYWKLRRTPLMFTAVLIIFNAEHSRATLLHTIHQSPHCVYIYGLHAYTGTCNLLI